MVEKKDSLSAASGRIAEAAVKPAATKAGKALVPLGEHVGQLTTRAGILILSPLRGVIWGGEQIVAFVEEKVQKRIEKIPKQHLQPPDAQLAGATIEALRYCGSKEELAEMFAALLAKSMDSRESGIAYPSFVEIIKQITPFDARIFRKIFEQDGHCAVVDIYSKSESDSSTRSLISSNIPTDFGVPAIPGEYENVAITNLIRLGLITRPPLKQLANHKFYAEIELKDIVASAKKQLGDRCVIEYGHVHTTPLGQIFGSVCLDPGNEKL